MYFQKYLKYKAKYIDLKNNGGGGSSIYDIPAIVEGLGFKLNNFYEDDETEKHNLMKIELAKKSIEHKWQYFYNSRLYIAMKFMAIYKSTRLFKKHDPANLIEEYMWMFQTNDTPDETNKVRVILTYRRIINAIEHMTKFSALAEGDPRYKILLEVKKLMPKLREILDDIFDDKFTYEPAKDITAHIKEKIPFYLEKIKKNEQYDGLYPELNKLLNHNYAAFYKELKQLYADNKKYINALDKEVAKLMKDDKQMEQLYNFILEKYNGLGEDKKRDFVLVFYESIKILLKHETFNRKGCEGAICKILEKLNTNFTHVKNEQDAEKKVLDAKKKASEANIKMSDAEEKLSAMMAKKK